jgi:hypothetical protein
VRTNTEPHAYTTRTASDTWCAVCNCTFKEHQSLVFLDADELSDYVLAHGYNLTLSAEQLQLARDLWAMGDDYPTIAAEIVWRLG